MKILFIYPTTGRFEIAPDVRLRTGAFLPPLGILYLAKILELSGHSVEVIDCNAEGFHEDTIKKALWSSDAVGMTIYSVPEELENSKAIAKKIKHIAPDIPLILGGPHCTMFPKQSLLDHQGDICVRGEAEHNISAIIEALEGKRRLSSIPGIAYRQKKTNLYDTSKSTNS